jgi:hypothetical protein
MATASVHGANSSNNNPANTGPATNLNVFADIGRGILSSAAPLNTNATVSSGVYVQTAPGSFNNYGAAVTNAPTNVTIGGSAASAPSVLGGSGGITYTNIQPAANLGSWQITFGQGNDTVAGYNSGHDTIAAGNGNVLGRLGDGQYEVKPTGLNATISGNAPSGLDFLQNSALSTSPNASLFGSNAQNTPLGNVTLGGASTTPGIVIDLVKGVTSGVHDIIQGLPGGVTLNLSGYDPTQTNYTITHPTTQGNQTTVKLDDNTTLTFDNATFKASKFNLS